MNRNNAELNSFANIRESDVKLINPVTTNINNDEPRPYYTEDTPALLSKVASNTNLSTISISSSNNECSGKNDTVYEINPNTNRLSLNLSDDVSSNASESGNVDILQQCIRAGMQKTNIVTDPIAMMRRGGNVLPPYLPVTDETNKFLVEDSPCNFSVVSGLSNLTVGSSLVGPAIQLKDYNGSVLKIYAIIFYTNNFFDF